MRPPNVLALAAVSSPIQASYRSHIFMSADSERTRAARTRKSILRTYVRSLARVSEELNELDDKCTWLVCARAIGLLDEMRQHELPLSTDVQNTAMRACRGRLDVVEHLFGQLSAAGRENEGSYAALMQARVSHGDVSGAAAALDALLANVRLQPRLRTCSPLVTRMCDQADVDVTRIEHLWERLTRRGVEFTPLEYEARLRMHARSGVARQMSSCLSEMLDRYPSPDASSVATIHAAVSDCAAVHNRAANVRITRLDASGRCEGGDTKLKLLGLSPTERARVRDVLLARAAARTATGHKHLQEYREWLRGRPPFDYVLDGPNIAYLGQNYDDGAFRYTQIQLVIETLQANDPDVRILLLLPQKYLKQEIPNHTCSLSRTSQLADSDWELIRQWREDAMMYECYSGLYDDWYWMYASVAETLGAEPVESADVAEVAASVPRVVTNDAMRDHWSELLPVRSFARWRHSQVAAFGLTYGEAAVEADGSLPDEAGADEEETTDEAADEAPAARVGANGAWVASPPVITIEAQQTDDGRWFIPVPLEPGLPPEEQQWLCLPSMEEESWTLEEGGLQ